MIKRSRNHDEKCSSDQSSFAVLFLLINFKTNFSVFLVLFSLFQFLTRALSFTVSTMSAQSSHKVLRREDSDNDKPGTMFDTSSNDWSAVIYTLAEQFGMNSDPLKCHVVRELYSAGLDSVAKEVLKDVSEP